MDEQYEKLVEKFRAVADDECYKDCDQYFRAGIDEGLRRAVEILFKYCFTME